MCIASLSAGKGGRISPICHSLRLGLLSMMRRCVRPYVTPLIIRGRERGREKDERRDPVEFADKSLLAVSCKIKNVDLLTIHFKLIVE